MAPNQAEDSINDAIKEAYCTENKKLEEEDSVIQHRIMELRDRFLGVSEQWYVLCIGGHNGTFNLIYLQYSFNCESVFVEQRRHTSQC